MSNIKEITIEIKVGTHIKGEEYPIHDFSAVKLFFKDSPLENMKFVINDDMLKIELDNFYAKNPDKDTAMYYYMALKE